MPVARLRTLRYHYEAMTPSFYFDNNATTRIDPRVLEAMMPLLTDQWGNVGSHHHVGTTAAGLVHRARRALAEALGAQAREIVITGGGTEADNLALRGVVGAAEGPCHLVTTAVEHPAVLETATLLQDEGRCELTVLGVDAQGRLDLDELQRSLRPGETRLVSTMWANNETGVVFPIETIGELVHEAGALLHVDAVQAVGKLALDVSTLPVDLLSISAHKFHGPKGVGALIVRTGTPLSAQLTGGGQERGRRSGTENAAGIVGLSRALELAVSTRAEAVPRMESLRDRIEEAFLGALPSLEVTGCQVDRICNTLNFTLPGIEADALLTLLDREGIACSSGSACSTGSLEPSHVLIAMDVAEERRHCALRISLSRDTTVEEVDTLIDRLPPLAKRLAALSSGEAA